MTVRQEDREALEISYWYESDFERPGSGSLSGFINKAAEGQLILEKFDTWRDVFASADTVLELGGGQGWVSCMLTRAFPGKSQVIASDISPAAVASVPEWERVLQVKLTDSFACRSYEIPLPDASMDLVFSYASAHHFGAHRRTFREIARVLKPGGHALYLHEPSCRDFLYERAVARVNRKRPVVREDVLRMPHIAQLAEEAGLGVEVQYAPSTTFRHPKETVYYMALQRIPALQAVLPCSVDILLTKPLS